MNKSTKRFIKGFVVLIPLLYVFPKFTLFYVVCGLYDVSRNSNLGLPLISQYFFGNGLLTWLLSPLNILLDLISLPFVNKGIYRLEDLPPLPSGGGPSPHRDGASPAARR